MTVKITLDAFELELIAQAVECGIEHGKPFKSDETRLRELVSHMRTMARKDRDETAQAQTLQPTERRYFEVIEHVAPFMHHSHLFTTKVARAAFLQGLAPNARKLSQSLERVWGVEFIETYLAEGKATIHP